MRGFTFTLLTVVFVVSVFGMGVATMGTRATSGGVPGTYKCTWTVATGNGRLIDPTRASLLQKPRSNYVVQTRGGGAGGEIIGALNAAFGPADVDNVRQLTGLGNMFTAALSPGAIGWLCGRAELDGAIVGMEEDHAVVAFGYR
jgi:hypothetical protein